MAAPERPCFGRQGLFFIPVVVVGEQGSQENESLGTTLPRGVHRDFAPAGSPWAFRTKQSLGSTALPAPTIDEPLTALVASPSALPGVEALMASNPSD